MCSHSWLPCLSMCRPARSSATQRLTAGKATHHSGGQTCFEDDQLKDDYLVLARGHVLKSGSPLGLQCLTLLFNFRLLLFFPYLSVLTFNRLGTLIEAPGIRRTIEPLSRSALTAALTLRPDKASTCIMGVFGRKDDAHLTFNIKSRPLFSTKMPMVY